MRSNQNARRPDRNPRRGAASVDYFLALGVVLPLAAFVLPAGRRAMQLIYELACALVAWPFL